MPKISDLNRLDPFTDISSAYVGKSGCMCGCRGNHKFTSKHRSASEINRGYEIRNNEVSDDIVQSRFEMLLSRINNEDYDVLTIEDFGVYIEYTDINQEKMIMAAYFANQKDRNLIQ